MLVLAGIAAGILAGYFGVGGGIIMVPTLIGIFNILHQNHVYVVQSAMATSLFTIIFPTLATTYKQTKLGNVNFQAALLIGLTSAVSAFLFSISAMNISGNILKIIFAIFLLIAAARMFFSKQTEETKEISNTTIHKFYSVMIGISSGIIAAFTGLGGGVFIIPMMQHFLKFSIKKAIGTSSSAILLTSAAGAAGYYVNTPSGLDMGNYYLGLIDLKAAVILIILSVPFSQLGIYLNNKTPNSILLKIFGAFVIIIAIKFLFFD